MSWSLKLHHGDLALSGAQFDVVSNEQKLVQDLRCWILERMGTDPAHPEYGSTIDGGLEPDGTLVPSVIGESESDLVAIAVEGEIHRIVQEYQAQQLARAKSDRFTYNKSTLTAREALMGVQRIDFSQELDVMTVNVALVTAAGNSLQLELPITSL